MRLAYFSPLTPQRSGISDYSEELLPELAEGAEIEIFVDGFEPSNKSIRDAFAVHNYRQHPEILEKLGEYDAILCHMGNNHQYHSGIYEVARTRSTVIVFHDFALQHFFLERARELGDWNVYLAELEADAGLNIRAEAEAALVQGAVPPQYHNPLGFPLNSRLANQAEGIIVHSQWSQSRLARIAPGTPIVKINHHVRVPEAGHTRERVNENKLSIASFGFITPTKGLESAIRALAALKSNHRFHYYIVGETNRYFDLEALIRLYGLQDRIYLTGYVSLEEFNRRMMETDIAINLRDQTVGETSGSLCRLMAAGVPTIVSNIGWFSELPDNCVVKIDPGSDADLQICAYLNELIQNRRLRQSLGENARNLVLSQHQVKTTAAEYLNFVDYVISRRAQRIFIDGVTAELALLSGNEPDELLLKGVAVELADLLPR